MISDETVKRLNFAAAAVFLVVGIVAASNTIRLNNYIRETLPRDTAQEVCQLATLKALRVWAAGRAQIADAEQIRDEALHPLIDALEAGQQVNPGVANRADDALRHLEVVRAATNAALQETPIPTCKLELGALVGR